MFTVADFQVHDTEKYSKDGQVDWDSYIEDIGFENESVIRKKRKKRLKIKNQEDAIRTMRLYEEEMLEDELRVAGFLRQSTVTIPAKTSAIVLENTERTQELLKIIGGYQNFERVYSTLISFYGPVLDVLVSQKNAFEDFEFHTKQGQKDIKRRLQNKYNPEHSLAQINVFHSDSWRLEKLFECAQYAQTVSVSEAQKAFGQSWAEIFRKMNPVILHKLKHYQEVYGTRLFELFCELIKRGELNHINEFRRDAQGKAKKFPLVDATKLCLTKKDIADFNQQVFQDFDLQIHRNCNSASTLSMIKRKVSSNVFKMCDLVKLHLKRVSKKREGYIAVGTKDDYYLMTDSNPIKQHYSFNQDVAPTHLCLVMKKTKIPTSYNKILDLFWFEQNKLFYALTKDKSSERKVKKTEVA